REHRARPGEPRARAARARGGAGGRLDHVPVAAGGAGARSHHPALRVPRRLTAGGADSNGTSGGGAVPRSRPPVTFARMTTPAETAPLDVLAVVAHRDDAELTCGGTLIKAARLGRRTGVLDLTQGEMGTRGSAELRQA